MSTVFIAGTTAELIKIAPVMHEMDARGLPYRLWSTAQHVDGVGDTLADLEIREPDRYLRSHRTTGVAKISQVPGWFADVLWTISGQFRALRREARGGMVLVHGDTFSTVVGALLGRLLGAEVGHIEAGLRSESIRSPFPEELNRRIVGRIADVQFAPTETERENLRKLAEAGRTEVIVTGANTVVDALRVALENPDDQNLPELPEKFGLVTLHRFELVQNKARFEEVLMRLRDFAEELPLVMVIGQSERVKLRELGLDSIFTDKMTHIDKRSYVPFLSILTRAAMVVTDSGGLQEECAALGIPCAVHRERTERHQGLGENVVLTGLRTEELSRFLSDWQSYRRPSTVDQYHPSRVIVDRVERSPGRPGAAKR